MAKFNLRFRFPHGRDDAIKRLPSITDKTRRRLRGPTAGLLCMATMQRGSNGAVGTAKPPPKPPSVPLSAAKAQASQARLEKEQKELAKLAEAARTKQREEYAKMMTEAGRSQHNRADKHTYVTEEGYEENCCEKTCGWDPHCMV